MNSMLLIDFGSTNTKLTAVDLDEELVLGTARAFTTVDTDINDGLNDALTTLYQQTGRIDFAERYACSSAAGGLRMIAIGLVPELTAEAAKRAALNAGAKVLKVYSYELTKYDVEEIMYMKPDIILLTGGTDGGNRDVILHNTNILAAMRADIPILVAGNRSVLPEVEELLQSAGKNVSTCDNVLPELNVLNTEPVQQRIRNLFLERIVRAKGLSRVKELTRGIIMPTPSAVFLAVTLLAKGYDGEGGIGELLAVDVGGATTDIYSIAAGECQNDSFFWKGLPELYEKRTVEGDLGLRYSSKCLTEQAGMNNVAKLAGLDFSRASKMLSAINDNYALIPENKDLAAFDDSLAYYAVTLASNRHAGTIEWHYTINGRVMIQTGKDLSGVKKIIGTGGPVVHSTNPQGILQGLLADRDKPHVLKPLAADLYLDTHYILAAMGLLAGKDPKKSIRIMKKNILKLA